MSRDLLRSSSQPAAQKAGDWPSVAMARHRVFMRTRSAMEVGSGSLYARRSKRVSSPWEDT